MGIYIVLDYIIILGLTWQNSFIFIPPENS